MGGVCSLAFLYLVYSLRVLQHPRSLPKPNPVWWRGLEIRSFKPASCATSPSPLLRTCVPSRRERPRDEDYLRSLLVKHLLYLEAQVWELQESMEVQKRVEASWHQHLIEIYRNEQPPIQVEVDEEEIRGYFEKNDLGRQRQLAGILVEEESQAQEVLAKLAAGESFEDLARQYSVHKGSAAQGGVWGYISRQQARRLKIPDEVFRELPVGVLSDILPINKRYLVMRFLQDQPGSLDEHRSRIHSVLHAGKLKEAKREQVRSLARGIWLEDRIRRVRTVPKKSGRVLRGASPALFA